ncbi:Tetratricopeptide repeat protein isoform 2 [Schistosoma japonicum]|uniref:Tetratricopeptide repeat protein isoform 2 n=2 Tax=Schistosoma japonicum TaxID=6182 RepID=A0A4Z2DT63_SCHJA|nr:Tetratricopeptide repeat protein 8 [Schistosoma japonicum]TNN19744.1 Tetratricopeptide repeat protein isoform 2 [Schistosoma japonicum]
MKAITEDSIDDDEFGSEFNLCDIAFLDKDVNNIHCHYVSSDNFRLATGSLSQAVRPSNLTSRPLTGVFNANSIEKCTDSIETVIRDISRPITSYYNKCQRQRTTAHLNREFVHISRLDLTKYAQNSEMAYSLFEYLFYVAKEYREALNLINLLCNNASNKASNQVSKLRSNNLSHNESIEVNWWWYLQKARCLYHLGLKREAESSLNQSLELNPTIESYKFLAFIAVQFDQPGRAIGIYDKGLERFPHDIDLLTGKARIYQKMNNILKSIALYNEIVQIDDMNIESLASLAMHYFYEDEPEISLKYYRRILQYGYESTELYNNLGLCTFYTQQYDLCLSFFNQAIALSDETNSADIYYNLGHIAINIGDLQMAYHCLYLAIMNNNNHSEAYNNLGVLEQKYGNIDMAKELYRTSCQLTSDLFEPHHNLAFLTETLGELQTSFNLVKHSLRLFPNHRDLQNLLFRLREYITST